MNVFNRFLRDARPTDRTWLGVVWLVLAILLYQGAPVSAGRLRSTLDEDSRDTSAYAFNHELLCAIFTPCPRLEIPTSVLGSGYDEEFDQFSCLMFSLYLVCDSTGMLKHARVYPHVAWSSTPYEGRKLLIEFFQQFFMNLTGKVKLRSSYVHQCASVPKPRYPVPGMSIFITVEVLRPSDRFHAYWAPDPSGYYLEILVPESKP